MFMDHAKDFNVPGSRLNLWRFWSPGEPGKTGGHQLQNITEDVIGIGSKFCRLRQITVMGCSGSYLLSSSGNEPL